TPPPHPTSRRRVTLRLNKNVFDPSGSFQSLVIVRFPLLDFPLSNCKHFPCLSHRCMVAQCLKIITQAGAKRHPAFRWEGGTQGAIAKRIAPGMAVPRTGG